MVYPEQKDVFVAKLNKKQDGGVYVIDEQVQLADGAYEGLLAHDNAVNSTVKVFTGPKLTGLEITSWTLSTPAEMPWQRRIRIFAEAPVVYVSYETPGDQVEADDVNALQEAVMATQAELDRYMAEGIVDGGSFYEGE
ncbi:phosphoglucomutase [Paenibacillus sp. YN15]|nr:phosphoglucomutase [Paenibacillus sp. YN15]